MSLVKKTPDEQLKLSLVSADTTKKRKMNVLDEDTYIQKLETIIEKSFFPDLERLKIQQAYNDAMKSNNFNALQELYEKYNKLLNSSNRSVKATPANATPAHFDTPNVNKTGDKPYANDEPPNMDLQKCDKTERVVESLDVFLAKNTSEDNVSFESLIEETDKKQKIKLHQSWLFEKEKFHQLKSEQSLMLENGPRENEDVIKSLDTWKYTSKNTLMYIPEGTPLTPEEELDQVRKTRVINHSNTRFSQEALNKIHSVSRVSTPSSQPNNPLVNPIVKLDVNGKEVTSKETPKIRGYSLVEASPCPTPGRLAGDESPMMVWGEIESTPMRLDPSQSPYTPRLSGGPEFKIPDIPEREKIALKLEEKMSAEKRKKKQEALKQVQRSITSPSRNSLNSPSVSDRINGMSPAAQRLLLKKKSDGSILTSPLVNRSPSLVNSPNLGIISPRIKTPEINSRKIEDLKMSLKRQADSSLTDDLLKLPKNN